MKPLNDFLLVSFDVFLLRCLVCLNLVKASYLKKFNKLLKRMSSKEENPLFLLKGNALFNNELIQFKSLELSDPNEKAAAGDLQYSAQNFTASNYSTSNYSAAKEDRLFEKLDQLNLEQLSQAECPSSKEDCQSAAGLFTPDMFKNFNSILQQNQVIEDRSSLQINEKDSSFDEETVDYRVEHIRKLASGLFMMNGDGLITSKSTLKKEIDYGQISSLNKFIKSSDEMFDLKKYSTRSELIDLSRSENGKGDPIFDLNESSSDSIGESLLNKSEAKYGQVKGDKYGAFGRSELKKYESSDNLKMRDKYESPGDRYDSKSEAKFGLKADDKASSYLPESDDLKAFEESLLERYKSIATSEKTKMYDSTGEFENGNSSPSSLNSAKSSDLSTTLADYNQAFAYMNNDAAANQLIGEHQNTIDYLGLKLATGTIGNSKQQVNEIEQKLNESRTENLNLMLALENNNTTMKKNLEMAKSLKIELETTKSNFDQFKQQTNLVVENLISKNKSLAQELEKAKLSQSRAEESTKKELDELKLKQNIEVNELRKKAKEKDDQLKMTTNDLYHSNKRIKEQAQSLKMNEQKLDEFKKKLPLYVKELNNQRNKLELNKEEIEVRKRRILSLEENLGDRLSELDSLRTELVGLRKSNKQLEERNVKLLDAVKQMDDKYKIEYEKRLSKEKDAGDLNKAIKRLIDERDESFKQLELLKNNWKQYQQQQAEQQLQLQQQLTTTPSSLHPSGLENKYGRLSKIYSSPALNEHHYYDTSNNSIMPASRTQTMSKHRLNEPNELLAIEKIEDEKSSLINVLSKQNYLNNLLSLSEQLNCDQCMLSNSISQFNTLQMNGSNTKPHLTDHSADLMNMIRQQKEMNELAFLKNVPKKLSKKESQRITKLEKK